MPNVKIGGQRFLGVKQIFIFYDRPIFEVDSPEVEGAPYRFNCNFFDADEKEILVIKNNEMVFCGQGADFVVKEARFTVKKSNQVYFIFEVKDEAVSVVKFRMMYQGTEVMGDETDFSVYWQGNGKTCFKSSAVINRKKGIVVKEGNSVSFG